MITLKEYQNRVLDSLRDFFRQCSKDGRPESAFQAVQLRNNSTPVPYIPVQAAGLTAGMPYACLRVPTGGGKTLLACHAAGLALKELLHAERGCPATRSSTKPPTRCVISATRTAEPWKWRAAAWKWSPSRRLCVSPAQQSKVRP